MRAPSPTLTTPHGTQRGGGRVQPLSRRLVSLAAGLALLSRELSGKLPAPDCNLKFTGLTYNF
jgi:hypothetical protein